MAKERDKRDLIAKSILQHIDHPEQFGFIEPVLPGPVKYKKVRKSDTDQPSVSVGQNVIVRALKGNGLNQDVKGYLRAVILDYLCDDFWVTGTTFICQVVDVSNDSLKSMKGRLISCRHSESVGFLNNLTIIQLDAKDWSDYVQHKADKS